MSKKFKENEIYERRGRGYLRPRPLGNRSSHEHRRYSRHNNQIRDSANPSLGYSDEKNAQSTKSAAAEREFKTKELFEAKTNCLKELLNEEIDRIDLEISKSQTTVVSSKDYVNKIDGLSPNFKNIETQLATFISKRKILNELLIGNTNIDEVSLKRINEIQHEIVNDCLKSKTEKASFIQYFSINRQSILYLNCLADIPEYKEPSLIIYTDLCDRVDEPFELYQKTLEEVFTKAQEAKFVELFLATPKDFVKIANGMNVSVSSAISFYYKNKYRLKLKRLVKEEEARRKKEIKTHQRMDRLSKDGKLLIIRKWSDDEITRLSRLIEFCGKNWSLLSQFFEGKSAEEIRTFYRMCPEKLQTDCLHVSKATLCAQWTPRERRLFATYFPFFSKDWNKLSNYLQTQSEHSVEAYYSKCYKFLSADNKISETKLPISFDVALPYSELEKYVGKSLREEDRYCETAGIMFLPLQRK